MTLGGRFVANKMIKDRSYIIRIAICRHRYIRCGAKIASFPAWLAEHLHTACFQNAIS
jgi:hypothetical protein